MVKELGGQGQVSDPDGTEFKKAREVNEKLFSRSEQSVDPALLSLIKQGCWKDKIRKEGDVFMHFFYVWMKYTDKLLGGIGSVPWTSIEGYSELVSLVMKRMARTEITRYSNMTRKAAWAMLDNERQFNAMVDLIFSKTKLPPCNNQWVVRTTLRLWTQPWRWWCCGHRRWLTGEGIPSRQASTSVSLARPSASCSPFRTFTLATSACGCCTRSCSTCLVRSRCIIAGVDEERAKIIEIYILSEENFYELFYHWSYYYRSQFQLLLLYHVQQWACKSYLRPVYICRGKMAAEAAECKSPGDSFVSNTSTVNLPAGAASVSDAVLTRPSRLQRSSPCISGGCRRCSRSTPRRIVR